MQILQEWQQIVDHKILIDWNPDIPRSLLLQIFSLPIFPNSLFFFEFIERRQDVKGFGERNFLALYEAIEAELNTIA
jgi:4-hydroxyphenylpyruvate dioxygenase